MAPMHVATTGLLLLLILVNLAQLSLCSRNPAVFGDLLTYHNGEVLQGDIAVSIMWYGAFTPAQKTVVSDFFLSLAQPQIASPSVNQWLSTINQVYLAKAGKNVKRATVLLAGQVSDESCSLGKSLKAAHIAQLAAKAEAKKGGIAVVLTAQDVAVEGFCMNRCGLHGADAKTRSVYVWVGNSATQCPGMCAWPFHQPVYGPQAAPLVAPNGDVGIDGMVINLATLVAGAMTNPFGDGFYQGPKEAPMEAASACPGVYGKGAYPGYAGDLLVDSTTGASYNANGVHGRKYLIPALFDPSTSKCYTLV